MIRVILLSLLLLTGCDTPRGRSYVIETCECFSNAAYDVLSSRKFTPDDRPKVCCGECKGTGYVLSGDGLAKVPCPCDDTCECKKKKTGCPGGKCPVRK